MVAEYVPSGHRAKPYADFQRTLAFAREDPFNSATHCTKRKEKKNEISRTYQERSVVFLCPEVYRGPCRNIVTIPSHDRSSAHTRRSLISRIFWFILDLRKRI